MVPKTAEGGYRIWFGGSTFAAAGDKKNCSILAELFDSRESLHLLFQRLVILPLDLQFGLELFDQQFEACDFAAQLQEVARSGSRPRRHGWCSLNVALARRRRR